MAVTKDPGPAAELTADQKAEILAKDEAEQKTAKAEADLSGKRLRAIPSVITNNGDRGTRVEIRKSDFAQHNIEHGTVVFDKFKDNFTLPVGTGNGEISQEAADLLVKVSPYSYEYMDNGS